MLPFRRQQILHARGEPPLGRLRFVGEARRRPYIRPHDGPKQAPFELCSRSTKTSIYAHLRLQIPCLNSSVLLASFIALWLTEFANVWMRSVEDCARISSSVRSRPVD